MDLAKIRDDLRHRAAIKVAEPVKKSRLGIILCVIGALLALPILLVGGFRTAAALRETNTAAELAPRDGKFVPTRSDRLFLQEKGTGTPVVLVHGTGAWSELWRPTIDHLADLGFRVIAVDMPPFGFSDRPQPPNYERAAQAARIADALESLKIEKAYLVGHSFGAGPTVEAALRYPEKVRGLVLVAPALGVSGQGSSDPVGLLAWILDQAWLRNALVAATGTNPALTRLLLSKMIYRKEMADDRAVALLQRPMTLQRTTPDFGVWLTSFLSSDKSALSGHRHRYADIKVSTTLIWGDQDTLTPLVQGHDIQSLIGGAELVVMRDVGHIPQLEEPAAFAKILGETLLKITR